MGRSTFLIATNMPRAREKAPAGFDFARPPLGCGGFPLEEELSLYTRIGFRKDKAAKCRKRNSLNEGVRAACFNLYPILYPVETLDYGVILGS